MNGNGKIIDPNADAAVRQAMASHQQQIQLAVIQFELRDRLAMSFLSGHIKTADGIREAYRMADLMLKIRMEKPDVVEETPPKAS
jgi:hypothetical protein